MILWLFCCFPRFIDHPFFSFFFVIAGTDLSGSEANAENRGCRYGYVLYFLHFPFLCGLSLSFSENCGAKFLKKTSLAVEIALMTPNNQRSQLRKGAWLPRSITSPRDVGKAFTSSTLNIQRFQLPSINQ